MKIIKPSAKLIEEVNPTKKIERIGRTCYKSEAKITEDSAEQFVKSLIKNGHYAMLEHATFVFVVSESVYDSLVRFFDTKYLNMTCTPLLNGSVRYLVSGNLRAINECGHYLLLCALCKEYPNLVYKDVDMSIAPVLKDEVKLINFSDISEPTEKEILKHTYYSVDFICDRGVSHELVRHRPCSFAQESTRYCNYSKEQYGKEITVIQPLFFDENSPQYQMWVVSVGYSESAYFQLLEAGAIPQEARSVLPNSLKTEIIMTANLEEWRHIFALRHFGTSGKPHPQMKEVMDIAFNLITEKYDKGSASLFLEP